MKGLILVYAIALIGAVVALKKPAIGLIIYVGFSVLRPHYLFGWAGDLSGLSDLIAIPMIIGWVVNNFGTWKLGRGRPIALSLTLFAVWIFIGCVDAQNTTVAFNSALNLGKTLLPFLIGITTLDSDIRVKQMTWTIVGAQAYISYELNMSYLSGFNRAAYEGYGGMDSNSFGISLISTIGPALAFTLWGRSWKERAIAAVCSLLILHTTLLTFSRGAMIGLATVGLCAFLMLPKRPKYLAGAVVVFLITARLVGPELMARYESAFVEEEVRDASAQSRVELWKACLEVIQAKPLFGVGFKNFGFVAANYGFTEGKEAHSTWLQVTAEVGIVGGLALLSCYFWTVIRLWPISRLSKVDINRPDIPLAFGIILSVVGFCVSAQFVTLEGLETPYYMAMLGVVLLKRQGVVVVAQPAVPVAVPAPAMSVRIVPPPRLQPAQPVRPGRLIQRV